MTKPFLFFLSSFAVFGLMNAGQVLAAKAFEVSVSAEVVETISYQKTDSKISIFTNTESTITQNKRYITLEY